MAHVPVMMKEVLEYLDPKPNQNFVDCTLGDGGHTAAILERTAPDGKVLGIDADPEAIASVLHNPSQPPGSALARPVFDPLTLRGGDDRLIAVNDNFRNLAGIVKEKEFGPISGILLDLGFSSSTLDRGRGFTFMKDEALDMRFDPSEGIRASDIVNGWNQRQLAELLEEYAEEKFAREIANLIVERRKQQSIITTKQLSDVIVDAYREKLHSKKEMPWLGGIHPATKTFQALRIEVNDELGALQSVLPQAVEALAPGGRFAVIAFHSLEDRIVKQFFRDYADEKIRLITKKPLVPTDEEIENNPRARSAKMRVIEKL
ncbi:MAG: 16S rRNA (cytosine(1402)-N(4))-methyltransferase RsmH [bacterium]|nr:16S rRNA (cytosine(1402)-N(4))-methyltransferase RsmH [bacterium]